MSSHQEEVLRFLDEFEVSAREYLQAKGVGEHEIANAHLELQWRFLHMILEIQSMPIRPHPRKRIHSFEPHLQRATIA